MCGIWAIFGANTNLHTICAHNFSKIDHRGPDAWRVEYDKQLKVCLLRKKFCSEKFSTQKKISQKFFFP